MEDRSRNVIRSMTMVTQISISIMVPIFVCGALGVWLNRLVGAEIPFLIMMVIGVGAAFRNVYLLTKSFYAKDMKKEQEQLHYIENLRNYSKEHPDEVLEKLPEGKKKRYPENRGPTRS